MSNRKYSIDCSAGDRTKQSFKKESDINFIVEKAQKSGFIPVATRIGRYMDVSEVPDYRQALEIVGRAEEAFMALPAKLRAKLDNDPSRLVDYLANPNNHKEAIELGLIPKPVEVIQEVKPEVKPEVVTP